jgi:hypothetical protein
MKHRDPDAVKAALALLSQGLATPGEIALRAGVPRQVVHHWAMAAGLDWKERRGERISRLWLKEVQRGFAVRRKVQRRDARACAKGGEGVPPIENDEAVADPVSVLPAQGGGEND